MGSSPALRPKRGETSAGPHATLSHRVSVQHQPNNGTALKRLQATKNGAQRAPDVASERWTSTRTLVVGSDTCHTQSVENNYLSKRSIWD